MKTGRSGLFAFARDSLLPRGIPQPTQAYGDSDDKRDMSRIREIFIRKLSGLLIERGWSNSDLARRLSISPANVSNWLSGRRFPRDDQIDAIAAAFSVDVSVLFTTQVPTKAEFTDQEALLRVIELAGYHPPKSLAKKHRRKEV